MNLVRQSWRPWLQCLGSGLAVMGLLLQTTACADRQPPPPAEENAKGPEDDDATADEPPPDTAFQDGEESGGSKQPRELSLAPQAGGQFDFDTSRPIRIRFVLNGGSHEDVSVGLAKAPSGATLDRGTDTPIFHWESPQAGTHDLQFVLRDETACQASGGSGADCEIPESEWGSVSIQDYDVLSETWTLEVKDDSAGFDEGQGGQGQGGQDAGDALGGANKGQLIQKILGAVAGGGGGNLENILQGLGGGQLQNILAQVQNGGDLQTILGNLLGGLFLKQEPAVADGGTTSTRDESSSTSNDNTSAVKR